MNLFVFLEPGRTFKLLDLGLKNDIKPVSMDESIVFYEEEIKPGIFHHAIKILNSALASEDIITVEKMLKIIEHSPFDNKCIHH